MKNTENILVGINNVMDSVHQFKAPDTKNLLCTYIYSHTTLRFLRYLQTIRDVLN